MANNQKSNIVPDSKTDQRKILEDLSKGATVTVLPSAAVAKQTAKVTDLTKSDKIRMLRKRGFKPGQIAKSLGLSYSHVYSVLNPWKNAKKQDISDSESDRRFLSMMAIADEHEAALAAKDEAAKIEAAAQIESEKKNETDTK